jgi:putative acetyltransferase
MNQSLVSIRPAITSDDLVIIRELFLEYANSLGFSLCFQGFDKELERLPGEYAPPDGRLYIAELNGQPAGCIAVKKREEGVCEMKRLYLRDAFRGHGIGRKLAERIIEDAKAIGYRKMVLDTIEDKMIVAVGLYRSLGFEKRDAYYNNPIQGALYMELELK